MQQCFVAAPSPRSGGRREGSIQEKRCEEEKEASEVGSERDAEKITVSVRKGNDKRDHDV